MAKDKNKGKKETKKAAKGGKGKKAAADVMPAFMEKNMKGAKGKGKKC